MAKTDATSEAEMQAAIKKAAGLPEPAPDLSDPAVALAANDTGPIQDGPAQGGHLHDDAAKSPAEWAYERLVMYIRNFEAQLDADQEVAMGFAGSEAGILQIEGLGFYAPDIVTFYGRDENGSKTQLIQHVSQLSVMLRAVPKAEPEEPARRIGFHLASGWTGGDAGDASV